MAAAVLAVTVFCVVLGSSSVSELVSPGRKLRWVALLSFAVIAVALAAGRRGSRVGWPFLAVAGGAAWLTGLAFVSTSWSVVPRLTFERAGSFALLVVAALAVGVAARSRPRLPVRLVGGILAGTVGAALAGVLVLTVDYGDAVQPVSTLYPARYRGLGQNPDTASMLEGMVAPIALWLVIRGNGRRQRVAGGATLALLLASISASGSRGGLLAAVSGGLVLAATIGVSVRRRVGLALAVLVAFAAATAATQIPKPLTAAPQAATRPGAGGASKAPKPIPIGMGVGDPETRYGGRLSDELFRIEAGKRTLLTSSGRLQAWYEAGLQATARPLLGYGFGTEDKVFIDRVYNFDGGHVENSFVGMGLQLGLLGLVSLLALLVGVVWSVGAAVRRGAAADDLPAALAGVVAAGLVLMAVQSFVYSVGNVATISFWTVCFVSAAIVEGRPARVFVGSPSASEGKTVVPS